MNKTSLQGARVAFEEWSSLAHNDPEAFEKRRNEFINQYIESLPEDAQQRMRQLQWRIDTVRQLAGTPMAACLKIYNMMWDSVVGEHGMVEKLNHIAAVSAPMNTTSVAAKKADVLTFRNQRQ
jgi:hypothetical protein